MSERNGIYWTNEKRRLGDLIPWPINPRQIKKDQAARLSQSLDEFAQVETIAVGPGNEVYNGHQRLNVWMAEYGPDFEVDVRVASRELSEDERKKLTVFLHKGAAGEWDFDLLANNFEVDDLIDWGFDAKELDLDLWGNDPPDDPGAQIDRAEELREKWGVESGQLWQLGEHRLICGDCTDKAVVERVMGGEKARLCVTSPPYYNQREYSQWDTFDNYMKFVERSTSQIINITDEYFALCWNIGDQCASEETRDIPAYHSLLFERLGLKYRDKIIWKKAGAVFDIPRSMHIENGKYFPALGHETILVYTRKHPSFDIDDKAKVREWQINVWEMKQVRTNNPYDNEGHSAQFPEELPERCIYSYTKSNEIIYEPFSGSGTTLIACERLGRKCRAVEISPAYCAVAIQRWVDMTGGEPVLLEVN